VVARLDGDRDAERAEVAGQQRREVVHVERLVPLDLRDAEAAADVHLRQPVTRLTDALGHRRHAFEGDAEPREVLRQEPVARVHVDRVDPQVVLGGDRERLVQLLGEDPELRRPGARVERLVGGGSSLGAPGRAGAGVHADPDRGAGRPPSPPAELRQQVQVHVHAGGEEDVQVALGDVRAGVADLLGLPAVLEDQANLLRRARVDPHRAERPDEPQDGRVALRLDRQAEHEGDADRLECALERPRLLLDPGQVVDEQRGPVLACLSLGVAAGDVQAALEHLEPRSLPPRSAHVGGRC
jgi:hypothetical protein